MSTKVDQHTGDKRRTLILLVGCLTGLVLAAHNLFQVSVLDSDEIVARVDNSVITRVEFDALLGVLADSKKQAITEKDKQKLLGRLIDEKLLLQEGEAQGLHQQDPVVRQALVNAVMQGVTAEAQLLEPSEAELQDFFQENRSYFVRPQSVPESVKVQQLTFPRKDKPTAIAAHTALKSGKTFSQVKAEYGVSPPVPVPDSFLPPHKLAQYIGPDLMHRALQLSHGAISEPIETDYGLTIVWVEFRYPEQADFSEYRKLVLQEYQRRERDKALRAHLDRLKQQADIVVVDNL